MSRDRAKAAIRRAWIAAIVSGTWTLAFTLFAVASGNKQSFSLIGVWSFVDVILVYALAYGIYRRSRVCAVLMLTAFVLGQVVARLHISDLWSLSGILVPSIFVYLFMQGARGTFAYHKAASEAQVPHVT